MKSRLLPLLSCLVGAALTALGLLAIVSYIRAAITDLSMLFWGLFLPVVGVAMLGFGAGLLVLGRKAWRGDAGAQRLAGHSLLGLAILATILGVAGHFRQQRMQAEGHVFAQADQLRADRERNARKLGQLDVALSGNDSILVRATPTPGLDGHYRFTLKVFNDQAVFVESSRELSLQGAVSPIAKRLRFADIFAKCFTNVPIEAYTCVRNTEARDSYTVRAYLELVDDGRGSDALYGSRPIPIQSIRTVELTLDTRTSDHAVMVIGAK